jgi:hypothetical protein
MRMDEAWIIRSDELFFMQPRVVLGQGAFGQVSTLSAHG